MPTPRVDYGTGWKTPPSTRYRTPLWVKTHGEVRLAESYPPSHDRKVPLNRVCVGHSPQKPFPGPLLSTWPRLGWCRPAALRQKTLRRPRSREHRGAGVGVGAGDCLCSANVPTTASGSQSPFNLTKSQSSQVGPSPPTTKRPRPSTAFRDLRQPGGALTLSPSDRTRTHSVLERRTPPPPSPNPLWDSLLACR